MLSIVMPLVKKKKEIKTVSIITLKNDIIVFNIVSL